MRFSFNRLSRLFFSICRRVSSPILAVSGSCPDINGKIFVSRLAYFYFFVLLVLLANVLPNIALGNQSALTSKGQTPIFKVPVEGFVTISPEHLEFLEGVEHTASLDSLEQAVWGNRLINDQSLVDGYWVRFRVANTLVSEEIGIQHNFNSEKKIFAVHSNPWPISCPMTMPIAP